VSTDDLSAPLGQNAKTKRRFRLPITVSQAIAGVLALIVLTFAAWAVLVDDPLGGEPMAVIATGPAPKAEVAMPPVAAMPGPGPSSYAGPAPSLPNVVSPTPNVTPVAPPAATGPTVTIINGSTGQRLEVPLPAPDKAAKPQPEQRMSETTRHGVIPKIGPDGVKPLDAFARATKPNPNKPDAPRIAIVLGGLGVSSAATQDALSKLPGPVTLAFLPYGNEIGTAVTRARATGHEVLLQLPMEPFDYPDNDPGPQTLLHSLNAEQNLDRLYWLLSRFQGYVGVANFMGARFTSHEPALAPVLRDLGKRGLIYFDDSSSPRSLAPQISAANNLPFAKADVVLDSVASPAHIDKALTRLEATARQQGVAVGVATALPATIQRIATWAKAVENRGFVLVPITAIAIKPKSS